MNEILSIIMPVYNHEQTVLEAIESVLMQETQYKFKLYCLNDASKDNSGSIINDYADKYPDIITVFHSDQNQGSGKKVILKNLPQVETKYWCLLAGDDYWTTCDKLEKQLSFLESHPDYVGCSGYTEFKNEVTDETFLIQPSKLHFNFVDTNILKNKYNFYVHPSSIIWRNIHRDDSFFPPRFLREDMRGDTILFNAMLASGMKMFTLPEVISCYRFNGRGIWSALSEKERNDINARIDLLIHQCLPFKCKAILRLQKTRSKLGFLRSLIPGPINS